MRGKGYICKKLLYSFGENLLNFIFHTIFRINDFTVCRHVTREGKQLPIYFYFYNCAITRVGENEDSLNCKLVIPIGSNLKYIHTEI